MNSQLTIFSHSFIEQPNRKTKAPRLWKHCKFFLGCSRTSENDLESEHRHVCRDCIGTNLQFVLHSRVHLHAKSYGGIATDRHFEKFLNMNHLQFTAPISLLKMSPSLCLGVTVFSSPQNKDVKAEDHAGRELNTLKSAQTIPQSVFWVINKTEPQTGRLEWPLKKPTREILCRNCFNI